MNLFTLKSALHYKLIRNTATYFNNKARIYELDSTWILSIVGSRYKGFLMFLYAFN